MQAPDDDSAVSVVGGAGSPGSQGSLMDPEGCSSTGAAEAVAEGAPPVEMAAPPGEMAAPPVEVAPPPVEGAAPQIEGAAPQIEGAAPPVEGALLASGQAEEASAPGRAPVNQLLEFNFTVPFLSHMDALVARGYLMPAAERYRGTVHWELRVAGRDLIIRLTSEDADILQISTATLLNRLAILVQNMQHFVTPYFVVSHPDKGG